MPSFVSTNPAANFSPLGEVELSTPEQIAHAVDAARAALPGRRDLGVRGRVAALKNIFAIYCSHEEELAQLITAETGRPITESRFDLSVDKEYFSWYLDNAERILSPYISYEDAAEIHTIFHDPMGVAAVIEPRNFPTMLFVRGVIPALLAGNTVVFKHSEDCILVGKLLAHIFEAGGLPQGVFTEVYGSGKVVGEALLQQHIDLISFTGSASIGKHIMRTALERNIKVIAELGGSAPGIVAPDADLQTVLDAVWFYRYFNNGQICDGLKRLIVHTSRYEEIVAAIKHMLSTKKIGDPTQESTDFGSLVAQRQVDNLQAQLTDARNKGAIIEEIGTIPSDLKGAYVLPSVITHISFDMNIWTEEVFGPVLPIVTYDTLDEAIRLANDTVYGLGAYLFTQDTATLDRCQKELTTKMLSVNGVNYCRPRNPFGGLKDSGMGSEHGSLGLYELVTTKVVAQKK